MAIPIGAIAGGIGALGGLLGGNSAQDQSTKLLKEAIARAREGYDARSPLRERAMGGLMAPIDGAQDLSALFANGSPYARQMPASLTQRGHGSTNPLYQAYTPPPVAPTPTSPAPAAPAGSNPLDPWGLTTRKSHKDWFAGDRTHRVAPVPGGG